MDSQLTGESRAAWLRRALDLQSHPEGGAFREVWRSSLTLDHPAGCGRRAALTSIYFLLEAGEFSAWHQVQSDEVWCIYEGALELHLISPEGTHEVRHLGMNLEAGQQPSAVVPARWWQAARPAAGADLALCGCQVAPGFDFADFAMPPRSELLELLPQHARWVTEFSR